MQRKVLSTEEINLYCLELLNNVPDYYDVELRSLVTMLYFNGLRPWESIQSNKYLYYTDLVCKFVPSKKNNIRNLNVDDFPAIIRERYLNHYPLFVASRVSQLDYLLKKLMAYQPVYVGEKVILSYIFRYNRVKLLLQQFSPQEVTQIFGWTESNTVNYYRDAELYVYE